MRTMYDSTTAADIPRDAAMVAGYIDGRFIWADEDWALFPNAVHVRIANFASTNDGDVLDVEWGDAQPAEVPGWVTHRREAGVDPSVYVNGSNWQAAKDACAREGVAEPHWWVADYGDGVNPRPAPPLPEGVIAVQYEHEAQTGGHYDLSTVADFWPGIDKEERMASPTRVGQSADLDLTVGQVGELTAIYNYPDHGGNRFIIRKVVRYTPGSDFYTVRPPVDPDADPTEDLSAEAAYFRVTAR